MESVSLSSPASSFGGTCAPGRFRGLRRRVLLSPVVHLRFRTFPDCYIEGAGLTRFKILAEYAICGILTARGTPVQKPGRARQEGLPAGPRLHRGDRRFRDLLHDVRRRLRRMNEAGHFLKVVSFYLIYRALIQTGLVNPFALIFRDLKRSRKNWGGRTTGWRPGSRRAHQGSGEGQRAPSSEEILERKQAEDALRESESKYRSLFQYANEAIFIAQDGVIRFSNPATERTTGYSIGGTGPDPVHRSRSSRRQGDGRREASAAAPGRGTSRHLPGADPEQGGRGSVDPAQLHQDRLGRETRHVEFRIRHHAAEEAGIPTVHGPEDGGGGKAGGRDRPRFQQPADRDPRILRSCVDAARA